MESLKTITVSGQTFTLERRLCAGGCNRDFWVRPESEARHARSDCQYTCGQSIDQIPAHILSKFDDHYEDLPDELFDIDKKPKGKKRKGISFSIKSAPIKESPKAIPLPITAVKDIEENAEESLWEKGLKKSLLIYSAREENPSYREEIGLIALSVVTTRKKCSIKQFAIGLGLDRKTLQAWMLLVKPKPVEQIIPEITRFPKKTLFKVKFKLAS